ncbi:MAG: hypothetical protein PWQ56_5 [Patescibacteria group bacterium]|nr:hypothetical protein [Patescibacteria group bacterium]
MENKSILLIIVAILVIASVGLFIFLNLSSTETGENKEIIGQQDLDNTQETEMVDGQLFEVGETYFVIEKSMPEENQRILDPEVELKYIQERIKVNTNPSTQIFNLSDIKYITVPSNITGTIETLKYLYSYSDEYVINVRIATKTPIINNETETDYVGWTFWPKGGF